MPIDWAANCAQDAQRVEGRMAAAPVKRCRGKSGLRKAAVPGNARAGSGGETFREPDGKRHRKQTARCRVGQPKPAPGQGETVG